MLHINWEVIIGDDELLVVLAQFAMIHSLVARVRQVEVGTFVCREGGWRVAIQIAHKVMAVIIIAWLYIIITSLYLLH